MGKLFKPLGTKAPAVFTKDYYANLPKTFGNVSDNFADDPVKSTLTGVSAERH